MSLYNIDLFISYAHIDNQPLSADKSGWISRFHQSLDTLLSMRLGKSVRIWRDDKLQGNDRFADEIVNQFKDTAILVSVLTPRYLNSEWCTREVNEFCNHVQDKLTIDEKARIFKIIKTPVDSEDNLPSIMQELLGYEFFVFEDGVPMELDDVYGKQYGQDFHRKVNKLAFDISELLKKLNDVERIDIGEADNATVQLLETAQSATRKPVVYLSECPFDMKETRDSIESQLTYQGYPVLPDKNLPRDEQSYTESVQSLLERSDISVHLIGQQYGAVPDGPSDVSTSVLQNRLAAVHSQQSNLSRLIWLHPQAPVTDPKQQMFMEALQTDQYVQAGADLLTGDIEQFKSSLQQLLQITEQQLNKPPKPDENADPGTSECQTNLYLICTEEDRRSTVALRKYLREHNIRVSMPAFKGDANEVRQANKQLLAESDVVMVFYGEGNEAWKRSIDTELRKLPAYLESHKIPKVFTYLAAPSSCDKDDLIEMDEPGIINGLESLAEPSLDTVFASTSEGASLP